MWLEWVPRGLAAAVGIDPEGLPSGIIGSVPDREPLSCAFSGIHDPLRRMMTTWHVDDEEEDRAHGRGYCYILRSRINKIDTDKKTMVV